MEKKTLSDGKNKLLNALARSGAGTEIINDSIYSTHVELTYSYGWGDCPSGCMWRRYWKFSPV